MRDIRNDLQDRANLLEEQINTAEAQFESLVEQLRTEHESRLEDLKAEFEAVEPAARGGTAAARQHPGYACSDTGAQAASRRPRAQVRFAAAASGHPPVQAQPRSKLTRSRPSRTTAGAAIRAAGPARTAPEPHVQQAQPHTQQQQPQVRRLSPSSRSPISWCAAERAGRHVAGRSARARGAGGLFRRCRQRRARRSCGARLVNKAGLIRQLPNGNFAPATIMDTIRLRRAI